MSVPQCPPISPEIGVQLFDALGIEMNPDNVRHFRTLMRSLRLIAERSEVYGDLWRQYGCLNNLVRAATKVDRAMAIWWHDKEKEKPLLHKDNLDDVWDAISYLLFMIQNAETANLTGEVPKRLSVVE